MANNDCALYVDGNGKYCCQDKVFVVGKYPVALTNANCDPVELIHYPTGDTDEVAVPSGIIVPPGPATIVIAPGKYKLPCPPDLDGTVAPTDVTLQKALCCKEIKTNLDAMMLEKLCAIALNTAANDADLTAIVDKLCALLEGPDGSAIEKLCAMAESLDAEGPLCEKLAGILTNNETWCAADQVFQEAALACFEVIKANTAAITGIETSLGQIGCTEDDAGNITGSVLVCKVSDTATDPVTDTIKVWWFGLDGEVIEDYTGPYVACTNLQALANLLQKICDKLDSVIEECCYVVDGGLTETARCQTFARPDPFGNGSPDTNYFVRVNGQQIDLPNPHTHADILAALNGVCGSWQILDDGNSTGRQVLCNTDLSCTSAVFGQCTDQGLNLMCSLATSAGIIVEPNVTCRRFIRTWGKFEEPIADTLAQSLAVQEDMLACMQADKGPQCADQTFGPLSDCIFPDDEESDIETVATDVYVDIKTCDGVPEDPFIYQLVDGAKEAYVLQGELANPDKTLFSPALECPDVPYEAATIQRKLNILDNSLWDNAPALNVGARDFPATDIEVLWTDGSTSVFNWAGGVGMFRAFRDWMIAETGCLFTNVVANWTRLPTSLPWGLTDADVPRECLFARGWSFMCCVGNKCVDTATVIASDDAAWVGASKKACTYDGPLETIYVGHVGCNVIYKDCDGNLIELPDGCCPIPSGSSLDSVICNKAAVELGESREYVNSDNETDITVSLGTDEMKWIFSADPPEPDATALTEWITTCVRNGGMVNLSWVTVGGTTGSGIITGVSGQIPDYLFSGSNISGEEDVAKLQSAKAVCVQEDAEGSLVVKTYDVCANNKLAEAVDCLRTLKAEFECPPDLEEQCFFFTYATNDPDITSVSLGDEDISDKFALPIDAQSLPDTFAMIQILQQCLTDAGYNPVTQTGRDGWKITYVGLPITLGR